MGRSGESVHRLTRSMEGMEIGVKGRFGVCKFEALPMSFRVGSRDLYALRKRYFRLPVIHYITLMGYSFNGLTNRICQAVGNRWCEILTGTTIKCERAANRGSNTKVFIMVPIGERSGAPLKMQASGT